MKENISNILTFDIEDWYQCTFLNIPETSWDNCKGRIEPQLDGILNLLKETNNKATFFTVALLARQSPEIIKRIVTEGHELALHSYSHKMLTELSEEEFDSDIRNSLDIFSSISKQAIIGFRAPYWSVTDKNKIPFKTYQYGNSKAPRYPNVLSTEDGNSIYEIPPSVLEYLNLRIPFSGGFYFRMLPYAVIKSGIKRINNEGYPAVTYFHPYDMDPEQPRIIKGLKERVIMYANQRRCKEKFDKLLHDFRFGRMDEYVKKLLIHV
jgi:peptidoglycan/xylan/chitin deacetylase (PgdA/CDA1 family)